MLTFNHTCIGSSHLQSGRPCQDASFAGTIDDLHIAIVSDGHGGKEYTRSDIGAQIAVQITQDVLHEFFCPLDIFDGCFSSYDLRRQTLRQLPFCQESHNLFDCDKQCPNKSVRDGLYMFRSCLVSAWREAVLAHAEAHPLSEQETQYATRSHASANNSKVDPAILYGCTLIAAVVCSDFWFVFQIGDGKCVTFHNLSKSPISQPIIEDPNCFLNRTTSLCNSHAAYDIHYCIGGASTIPYAILLGTDGIENSWGTDEKLYNFYIDLLKQCDTSSPDQLLAELQQALPLLSQAGSHDDMSIAGIVNMEILHQECPSLLSYQIRERQQQLQDIEQQRQQLQQKIQQLQEYFDQIDIERLMRDLHNMQSDLDRRTREQQRLQKKLTQLQKQQEQDYLSGAVPSPCPATESFSPPNDDLKHHYEEETTDLPF